jgi:hypothetical protein
MNRKSNLTHFPETGLMAEAVIPEAWAGMVVEGYKCIKWRLNTENR